MPVVPIQAAHIAAAAHIHAEALAGDFLPSLGEPFLSRFYKTVLNEGLGFGFVQLEEAGINGFVIGSVDTSSLFRKAVLSAGIRMGMDALPAILRRPALLLKVLETFLYPGRESFVVERAELLVIAVAANQRGKSVGRELVQALNDEFRKQGVQSYKVTVLNSNDSANRFYQHLGFHRAGRFKLYQKSWNLYTYTLGATIP
jgi:ribosomal protein S18 acetylase RimI-like enzyme